MGSRRAEELLSMGEAARLLGKTKNTILYWTHRGTIDPIYVNRVPHYRAADIYALAEVTESGRRADMNTMAQQAVLAYVTAKSTQRRLDELVDLLGLTRPSLGCDEASVVDLYTRATHALLEPTPIPIPSIREWAGVFFAIDESYLQLISRYTLQDEPWKVPIDLGDHLAHQMPLEETALHPPVAAAYAYLKAARDHLRSVSYFYCRSRLGRRTANRVFEEERPLGDRLCSLMFPR